MDYINNLQQWMPVREFPNYMVSSHGRVMNIKTFKVLKPATNFCKHSYIDSTKIFDYFFIMFVDNATNRLINFIQQDDSWEYNGSIQTFNNFTFDIYMDGVIDNGITINNPFLIELEYF